MAKTLQDPNPDPEISQDGSASSLKLWTAFLVLIVGLIIILVSLRVCVGTLYSSASYLMSASEPEEAAEESAEEPAAYLPEATELPNPTPTMPSTLPGEVTHRSMVISTTRLGEVHLSYPVKISPQSSNIVRLSISRPPSLASSDPMSFQIVEIDQYAVNSTSPIHGELYSDRSTILVDDQMKVELSAQAFEVVPHFSAVQKVDLDNPDAATNWAWTITAPQTQGLHVLNFSVFVDEESPSPSWFGAYQLEVSSPTPHPPQGSASASGSTAQASLPEVSIFATFNQLIDLLTIFSTLSAGVIAIKRRHLKRQVNLTEMIRQYQPADEMERIELAQRISELESIKWWQFWK